MNYLAGVAVRRGELTEVHASGGPATFLSTDPLTGPVAAVVYPWEDKRRLGMYNGPIGTPIGT